MPYFITDKNSDCNGWAVIDDAGEAYGCHETKQGAIDQAVAISISDDEPFEGERAAGDPKVIISDIDETLIGYGAEPYRIDSTWNFIEGLEGALYLVTGRPESDRAETESQLNDLDITFERLIMNPGSTADSVDFKKAAAVEILKNHEVVIAIENDDDTREAYQELGIETVDPEDIGKEPEMEDTPDMEADDMEEMRAVDLTPPAYMRAAARRGIAYYEEGKAGDGVVDATIREARAMASGTVTADKWVRIAAWIARHLVDLDAPAADPSNEGFPSAGVVAHLLWGSGPSKRQAERAMSYANDIVAKIEADNEGRAKGKALSKLETRINSGAIELRETTDGMVFEGYAAVFDAPSEPLPFTEKIQRGAFSKSLKSRNDIKLLWNHDSGQVLASTRAKTLSLVEDEHGLKVSASLPNTTLGRDTAELLRRGDVDSMSFGFSVIKDSWNAEGSQRTLNAVRLHEVSIVAWPAYTATSGTTSVRGLDVLAERADVDVDALADALLKVESGEDITVDDRNLLTTVIDKLSPAIEATVDDASMLALKKKKLELLKGI